MHEKCLFLLSSLRLLANLLSLLGVASILLGGCSLSERVTDICIVLLLAKIDLGSTETFVTVLTTTNLTRQSACRVTLVLTFEYLCTFGQLVLA